jgi:DNA-binding IclR family transcriptional regulator
MASKENEIKSIGTTLEILEEVIEADEAGVTEIADRLSRNKGTVHHHLSTLSDHGYLVNTDGTYRPSARFFEIGQQVIRHRPVYEAGSEPLQALADETGELVHLMIEENGRGIYADITGGDNAITLHTSVGDTEYLHCCALGKAILANLGRDRRREIYEQHGLPQETANTITDRGTLEAEFQEIRDRGWALDDEENWRGLRCVAAPILTDTGTVKGAISLSAPKNRLASDDDREEYATAVKNAANLVELSITYS